MTCLLNFGRRRPEQFDVSGADTFPVLGESFRRIRFIGKQYEGIAGRPAIGLPHEQDAVGAVQHGTGVFPGCEKVQLRNKKNYIVYSFFMDSSICIFLLELSCSQFYKYVMAIHDFFLIK